MTPHLSPQEFIEVLDGALQPARQSHLDGCDGCRRETADIRALLDDVGRAAAVPEPSPLFWEHLSRRVRAATSAEALPARRPWWQIGWRPLMAVSSVLAAVVLTVVLRGGPGWPASRTASDAVPAAAIADQMAPAGDDDSLIFVANVAATMPYEDMQQLAQPSSDATDAMVEQLTPSQRTELVRLLREQMRGAE